MLYLFLKHYFKKRNMAHIRRALESFLAILLIVGLMAPSVRSQAAKGRDATVIIRDAETEDSFKEWLAPLLKVAGMNPDSVNIVIVQNPQLNAFVAGGSNIFIYTGLIERTENPGEMIGVMAHELGHIAGGHLIATRGAFERASYESILGMVLGIGTAIATGNGEAANAIISGSSAIATSNFLSHSRLQESSADQAAMRFLQDAQINPSGLPSFFEKLASEELIPASQQSAYMRTHPLTRDRIDAVRQKVEASPLHAKPYPPEWIEEHARIKAKLSAFLKPGQVPWIYSDNDKSVPAKYARAIAAYRTNDIKAALADIDDLISIEPANPYFKELKGQMLVDFGQVREAVPYYRAASEALPKEGLIRMALGHALLESGNDEKTLREAADHIERALVDEPRSARAHRLLATAYGRLGNENLAKLHLAEEAILQRRLEDAKTQAEAVHKTAAKGSRESIHAKDILAEINRLKKIDDNEEEQ